MLSTFIISGNNRGDDETDRQSVSDIQTTNDKSYKTLDCGKYGLDYGSCVV